MNLKHATCVADGKQEVCRMADYGLNRYNYSALSIIMNYFYKTDDSVSMYAAAKDVRRTPSRAL